MKSQPKMFTLPIGHKLWLDIRTINIPKLPDGVRTPESDLHIVSDLPFSDTVSRVLRQKGLVIYNIESPIIKTKAVSSIRFDEYSRSQGYELFQEFLLHPDFFGLENGFSGYMEFEARNLEPTKSKILIPWVDFCNPHNRKIDLPFLNPLPVVGTAFKRGDLHLSVSRIDRRTQQILLAKGFYYADFTNRETSKDIQGEILTGLHRVLTIQSARIGDTLEIKRRLVDFVRAVGGVEGTILDEPTLAYVRTKRNAVPPCSNVRVSESKVLALHAFA
jgi:hypothetical protein